MPKEHEVACYPGMFVGIYRSDVDISVDGAKTKPTSLVIWEAEQHAASRQQYSSVEHDQQSTATVSADATTDGDDDDDDDDVDNDLIVHEVRPKGQQHPVEPAYTVRPPDDHQLATSFLSGQYCLYGGAGWWKHEYCHGKHVIQFHEEQQQSASASRAEIVLGVWDKNVHLQWIAESPHKKPIRVSVIGKICEFYRNYLKIQLIMR
jgi:endoplasmic reticulum lectin 1